MHFLLALLLSSIPQNQSGRSNWTERLTAPFRFGGRELLPSALKLTSAVTVTAVLRRTAAQLGRQLLGHHVRYQAVAQAATSSAAKGIMTQWQRQAALTAAQKGLTSATLRYSAVQVSGCTVLLMQAACDVKHTGQAPAGNCPSLSLFTVCVASAGLYLVMAVPVSSDCHH